MRAVTLDGTLKVYVQCTNDARTPTAPGATPTYVVYGPSGSVASGTMDGSAITTGLYAVTLTCSTGGGYAVGPHVFRASYSISSVDKVEMIPFQVV